MVGVLWFVVLGASDAGNDAANVPAPPNVDAVHGSASWDKALESAAGSALTGRDAVVEAAAAQASAPPSATPASAADAKRTLLQSATDALFNAFSILDSDSLRFAEQPRIAALHSELLAPSAPTAAPTAAPTFTFEDLKGALHAFFATVNPRMEEQADAMAEQYRDDESALNARLRRAFGGADVRRNAHDSRLHSLSYHPGKGVRPTEPTTWQLHRVDATTVACTDADAADCPRRNFSVVGGIWMADPNPAIVRHKLSATGAAPWKHCYDECALRFGCEAYSSQTDHHAADGVIYCHLFSGSPLLRRGPGDDGVTRTSALMPITESDATRAWRARANKRNSLHSTVCRIFGAPFAQRFNEASATEQAWERGRREHAAEARERGAQLRRVQLLHLRALTNYWAIVPFGASSHRARKHRGFEAESWKRFDMTRCCDVDAGASLYCHRTSSENKGAVPCAGSSDEFPAYFGCTKGGVWDLEQSGVRWKGNTGYDAAFVSALISAQHASILNRSDSNFAAASEGQLHHSDEAVLSGLLPLFPTFPIGLDGEFALGDAATRPTRERKRASAIAATDTLDAPASQSTRRGDDGPMPAVRTAPPTPFSWSESRAQRAPPPPLFTKRALCDSARLALCASAIFAIKNTETLRSSRPSLASLSLSLSPLCAPFFPDATTSVPTVTSPRH
jgi:hypothetical protein